MSNDFPISINHNFSLLPKNLQELKKLTQEQLENEANNLPTKTNNQTFVNNNQIDGRNYIRTASRKSFTSSSQTQSDLNSVTGHNNRFKTKKGDDYIFSHGNNNQIESGEGNDTVILTGHNNRKIYLEKGDDLAFIAGNNNTIGHNRIQKYNEGDDSLAISGKFNTVYTGDGDDTVLADGEESTINTGEGNDKVAVSGQNNIIETYNGDDIVSVEGSGHKVNTDRGNDTIEVKGNANFIDARSGNDTIFVHGADNKILAGDGDDTIIIESKTENIDGEDVTYTPSGGFIDAGDGNDTIIINDIEGNFKVDGGSGTNTLKLTNIDYVAYSGTYKDGTLELFKANGTGNKLTIELNGIDSVEFSGNNVKTLDQLVSIQGKTIELDTTTPPESVTNNDGESNVLELDFTFSALKEVSQLSTNKYEVKYLDTNNNEQTFTIEDIHHLKSSDDKTVDLTQTPNFVNINGDITNYQTSSTRNFGDSYQLTVFNPSGGESYQVTVDANKDKVLSIDPNDPSQVVSESASKLLFETYGKTTAVGLGVANNTNFSNTDGKTNVADFSAYNTEDIFRAERLVSNTYQNVAFEAVFPSDDMATISINFDGVSDLDTIINNYNGANPTATVQHKGTGTDVLSAGTLTLKKTDTVNNKFRVVFNDGGTTKSVVLDRINFIETKEGQTVSLEKINDSLKNSLEVELSNIDTAAVNYDATAHTALRNTQFRRGAYNILSEQNNTDKFDALASIAGATYQLLPDTGNSIVSTPTIESSPNELNAAANNLIDDNALTYYSTQRKTSSSTESVTLNLGSAKQFSRIEVDPRYESDVLFPSNFTVKVGNDVNNLTEIGTFTSDQIKAGADLASTQNAQYIRLEFATQQLGSINEYYAEIGGVTISDPASVTESIYAATISDYSSQDGVDVANNLVDNNNTSIWKSVAAGSQTTESVLLDLATSQNVNKIRIRPASGATNFFPNDLDIYVGDDPFNLTLASSITGYTNIDPLFNDFSFADVSGRYVKINMKTRLDTTPDPDEYFVKLAEIDVIGTTVGSGALAATVQSTSSNETTNHSTTASHVIDGDNSTFYSSAIDGSSQSYSLTLDFGSSQSFTGLNLTERANFSHLFPNFTNVFIDNNTNPVTAVTNLTTNGTNLSFDTINGRYVKLQFNTVEDNGSGNFLAQFADIVAQTSTSVKNKGEVHTLANELRNNLNFTSSDSNYQLDEATKSLYSLRMASILRNRSDLVDLIKNSGLTVEFDPNPTINHNGTNANGLATFTQGSTNTYKIQLTTDSFFHGANDNEDGFAVDIHETVHILDYLSGSGNGSPALMNAAERLAFGNARGNLFAPLDFPATPPLGEGLLYSPGANDAQRIANAEAQAYANSREFLAYATEDFFERGDELVALGADGNTIYEKLRNYFGLTTNVADPDTNVFSNIDPVL